jgi:hypothetical protein
VGLVRSTKVVAGADPQFGDLLFKIATNKYRLGWLLEMARGGPLVVIKMARVDPQGYGKWLGVDP